MPTARRTTRRPPALRLEELSPREVWSVSSLPTTAVVYDVSFSLAVSPDPAVQRAVTFTTPDGASYAGALTQFGTQLTGRLDHDFSIAAAGFVVVRVTETTPTYQWYREVSLELTPQPATDGVAAYTGPALCQFGVPLDTGLGAVTVLSSRPLQLTPGELRYGLTNADTFTPAPAAPPVVTTPPVVPTVPPPAVTPPPGGAQQVPPAGPDAPATVPPAVVPPPTPPPPPPRRPDTPITPLVLASAQFDHVAGAFVSAAVSLPAGTAADRVPVGSPTGTPAARVTLVPWTTPYSVFAGAAVADFDARDRGRSGEPAASVVAASASVRTPSRATPSQPAEDGSPAAEPTWEVDIVAAGADQALADAVLLRQAARPLPPADPPREKRPGRLFGAFSVVVMGGLGLRWFRTRPTREPGEKAGDRWVPPLL